MRIACAVHAHDDQRSVCGGFTVQWSAHLRVKRMRSVCACYAQCMRMVTRGLPLAHPMRILAVIHFMNAQTYSMTSREVVDHILFYSCRFTLFLLVASCPHAFGVTCAGLHEAKRGRSMMSFPCASSFHCLRRQWGL